MDLKFFMDLLGLALFCIFAYGTIFFIGEQAREMTRLHWRAIMYGGVPAGVAIVFCVFKGWVPW